MTKLVKKKPSDLNLEEHLKKMFPTDKYVLNITQDEIKITDIHNTVNELIINNSDLQEEFSAIIHYGKYYTLVEDRITFILMDNQSVYKGKKIQLSGGSFTGKIEKKNESLALLLLNSKEVIDFDKLNQSKQMIFEDVISDNILVCELNIDKKFLDIENLSSDQVETSIDHIINSLLAQTAFRFNLILSNPRNLLSQSNNHILKIKDEDTLSVKFIKDYEPLLYFLSAEEMEYPHLKYLEYYHVLEYYFNHKKVELMDKLINKVISTKLANGDNLQNASYYSDLNRLVKNQFNNDYNSEISQLIEVINDDLGFTMLKTSFEDSNIDFKELKKSIFDIPETGFSSHAKVLASNTKFKDETKSEDEREFCKDLANRIYKIRNHIVHTKKYENKSVFIPSSTNFEKLKDDLILIRLVSYLLITSHN